MSCSIRCVCSGALRGGYVVVNCNPLYKARELEYQLRDCEATTIVILENFARTLMKVARRYPIKHIVMARWAICWD